MLFCLLIVLLFVFASSQDCDNPLGLYQGLSLLSFQIDIESEYCSEVLRKSCCYDSYIDEAQEELDLLKADHDSFGDTLYQELLDMEDAYWTLIDDASTYFPDYFEELESYETNAIEDTFISELENFRVERELCFESLWEHTASLFCLSCSYFYSDFLSNDDSNDIITLELNYTVCSDLQNACHLYAETLDYWVQYSEAIDFTARALYAFYQGLDYSYVTVYTDLEKEKIEKFERNFTNLKCLSNSISCYKFCDSSITATGFNSTQLEPTNYHFEWSVENVDKLHSYLDNYGVIPNSDECFSDGECKKVTATSLRSMQEMTEEYSEGFKNMLSNQSSFIGLLENNRSRRLVPGDDLVRTLQSSSSEVRIDYSLGFELDTIYQGNLTGVDWTDKVAFGPIKEIAFSVVFAFFVFDFAF